MNWLQDNIVTIISALTGGTSLLGYFSERKRRVSLERQEASDALKSMQAGYDAFTEDYLKKYTEMRQELVEIKSELKEVTKELRDEKAKNRTLEKINIELLSRLGIADS